MVEKDTKNGEKEMKIENLDEVKTETTSEEESFPTGKFREVVKPSETRELTMKVENIETLNTKFGKKYLICGGGKCIFGNKLIFTKLANYGIRKPADLKGKTIYLKSVDVVVMGITRKTFILEGVE